eukprot:m.211702 g.211702  ORF g.211702 m.211702 type:complete len:602 (+) comp25625_c0_seq1:230-2035(+)
MEGGEQAGRSGPAAPGPSDLGPSARVAVRKNLTKRAREPLVFIREFQESNGLGTWSNCSPAMPMVDLHDKARPDVYKGLLDTLRTRLLERLKDLSGDEREALLKKAFPFIQLPEIQPIVLEVLRTHKDIPPEHLHVLSQRPELLDKCAVEVKRQVWQTRPKLFAAEVQPLLLKYVANLRRKAIKGAFHDFDKFSPRKRRATPEVKDILKLIGKSVPLYNETLRAIRTHFIATGDPGCCALRTDLLMSLSDAGITTIVKRDPLRQFVEWLVICVTDRTIDTNKAATLSMSLDDVQEGAMIGDIGMVILDPCIQMMLSKACFGAVRASVQASALPSKSKHLEHLTQVFCAVSRDGIRRMMKDQAFERLEMFDRRILTWFYPTVAAAIVEDKLTATMRQRNRASKGIEHGRVLPAEFDNMLQLVPGLRAIIMYYVQDRLAAKDVESVAWALPLLADTSTAEWLYGTPDPAGVDEQFARMLARLLSTSHKTQFAGKAETALGLMETFFVPRARRSTAAQVDAIALVRVLRREVTVQHVDAVETVIETLCTDRNAPATDHGMAEHDDEVAGDVDLLTPLQSLLDVLPDTSQAHASVAAWMGELRSD